MFPFQVLLYEDLHYLPSLPQQSHFLNSHSALQSSTICFWNSETLNPCPDSWLNSVFPISLCLYMYCSHLWGVFLPLPFLNIFSSINSSWFFLTEFVVQSKRKYIYTHTYKNVIYMLIYKTQIIYKYKYIYYIYIINYIL